MSRLTADEELVLRRRAEWHRRQTLRAIDASSEAGATDICVEAAMQFASTDDGRLRELIRRVGRGGVRAGAAFVLQAEHAEHLKADPDDT